MKTRFFISTVVLFCTTVAVFGGFAKKQTATRPATTVRRTGTVPAKTATTRGTVPAKAAASRGTVPAKAAKTKGTVPAKTAASRGTVPLAPGYRPAGTVSFANLETIAQAVMSIAGPQSKDPILKFAVPRAIRNQGAAKLFGAMRPGAHGVAVCYVDPAIAARVTAAKVPSEADLDRVKRWTVVYPAAITKAAFMQRHSKYAQPMPNGVVRILPGSHSKRTLYAYFPVDGQWAVLAPAPAMALNAYSAAARALARPIGGDLAFMRMDAMGTRALFGSNLAASGTLAVRMTARGLELRGSARGIEMRRPPLPKGALNFAGIPRGSVLYGVTTTPSDVQMAETIFAMAGPAFGSFVRSALKYVQGTPATGYYLSESMATPLTSLARLNRILPEAAGMPSTANAMFCSPTTVMRQCLPKVAAKMMPFESAKMQVALRLLRGARGEGLGCMSWREGDEDKLFIRISRDELYGTANLWSMLLF